LSELFKPPGEKIAAQRFDDFSVRDRPGHESFL
jgi:hypothetical protein